MLWSYIEYVLTLLCFIPMHVALRSHWCCTPIILTCPDLLYCLFIFALLLEIQLKEGKGWYPIIKFISTSNIFATVPSNYVHCQCHMSWSISFPLIWARGGCSFCWYRWNCWPSLFISILFNNYLPMYMPWQWEVNNNIFILFSNLFYVLIWDNIQK
jgi:hypothetical protein